MRVSKVDRRELVIPIITKSFGGHLEGDNPDNATAFEYQ